MNEASRAEGRVAEAVWGMGERVREGLEGS